MAVLNEKGAEELDQTPIVINLPSVTVTMMDDVRLFIRRELSQAASADGGETFEEANDFDVGDDYEPESPWEYEADQEEADMAHLRAEFGGNAPPGEGESLANSGGEPLPRQDGIPPASAAGAPSGEAQPPAQK